ncbi:L,D-transpeptidase family protein [Sphingomonas sp. KRR8]|uniref:L,D-transpeptidase family protein n=1 Tax=Sphingomonas sp. KRR8 TaxID=2942996 RepID=UPI00202097A8|nr:L,D-transpeptidase family protein [Sphingomonas sp. KRR8]URD61105.1 L,D-transpeptidase family protein [Sphingomonas sp. KRR8]
MSQIVAEAQAFHRYPRNRPFWTPAAIGTLLTLLDSSDLDGLSPQAYHVAELRRLSQITLADPRQDRRAMDVALSVAFVRFAADLARGADTGVTYVDPAARPRPVRPTILLLRASESGSVQRYIETLAWMNPIYGQLRKDLAQTVDPARARLLKLNLRRARVLPRGPARYVLVNIPSARLEVREGDHVLTSMKVIVGLTHTQTPVMAGMMRYAIRNPSWHIPTDITREKVAPRVLKEGAAYLRNKNYEVLSDFAADAKVLDPAAIDWTAVVQGKREAYVRQKPGPTSGLGKIVFKFPNEMGIYLHDTPGRALFQRDDRLASAGCVRLEDADGLARLVLGRPLDPNVTETDKYMPLPQPVPVYLTYLTAFPISGQIVAQKDIYGKDELATPRIGALAS